jgi:4-amino-4-deoxy-L-arabinose transferase-like glycosyltransferase
MKAVPRISPTVWAITGIWGVLLILYSVLFPTYRGPDENRHVDLIMAVRRDSGYPRFDERKLSQAMVRSMESVQFERKSLNLTEEEAPARSARPRLAGPLAELESGSVNQIPQHPPLYYALMAGGSAFADTFIPGADRWPFDKYVWFLRFLNLLIMLPLPALAYLVARELEMSEPAAVTASIFPLAVPQLTHIGATVNNDNLLTILIGVLILLMLKVAKGDASRRLAIGAGVVGGAALLTKGFALFLPLWFLLAYLVGAKLMRREAWRSAGIALGLMVLIGGWWWVRNIISLGTIQPGIPLLPPAPAGFVPDYLFWLGRFAAWMPIRFWGWFGWFDVRLPLAAPVVATAAVVIGVVTAFVSRGPHRRLFVVLLTPVAAIASLTAAAALRGYLRVSDTPAIQGRYLFPGLIGLGVVTIWGLMRLMRRERWVLLLLLAGAAAIQVLAFSTALTAYWGSPSESMFGRLGALGAWSAWPPAVPAAVAMVILAGCASLPWLLRPGRGELG